MKSKFNFTITGFVIGMILISVCAVGFAMLFADMSENMSVDANVSFAGYNKTQELKEQSETIRTATQIRQDAGILDVIGGFFSSGYNALKISGTSVDLFVGNDGLLDEAVDDVPVLSYYKDAIIAIVIMGIFIGIFVTVLVKWRL